MMFAPGFGLGLLAVLSPIVLLAGAALLVPHLGGSRSTRDRLPPAGRSREG